MFYAIYHPYGLHTINTDGVQANELLGYGNRSDRDRAVASDPEHYDIPYRNLVRRITAKAAKQGALWSAVYVSKSGQTVRSITYHEEG